MPWTHTHTHTHTLTTHQAMRRVAFAAFGILNGTEVNPDFESEVGWERERETLNPKP
jgi:hypothetical protein